MVVVLKYLWALKSGGSVLKGHSKPFQIYYRKQPMEKKHSISCQIEEDLQQLMRDINCQRKGGHAEERDRDSSFLMTYKCELQTAAEGRK